MQIKHLLITSICLCLAACDSKPIDATEIKKSFNERYPAAEILSYDITKTIEVNDKLIYELEGSLRVNEDNFKVSYIEYFDLIVVNKTQFKGDVAKFSLYVITPKQTNASDDTVFLLTPPITTLNVNPISKEKLAYLYSFYFRRLDNNNTPSNPNDNSVSSFYYNPASFDNDFKILIEERKQRAKQKLNHYLEQKSEFDKKQQELTNIEEQLQNFWLRVTINGQSFDTYYDFKSYLYNLEDELFESHPELNELKKQIEELENDLYSQQKLMSSLNPIYQNLEEEYRSLKIDYNKKRENVRSDIHEKIQILRDELEAKQEELMQLLNKQNKLGVEINNYNEYFNIVKRNYDDLTYTDIGLKQLLFIHGLTKNMSEKEKK